jgi:PHD/YefM family antitoxin component YafN of YafNO toxin-antitoxin module
LAAFRQGVYFDQGQSTVINPKKTMVHRLPITKARTNLGQVVKRVHVNKEYFILEKDGIPVAGILDAEELEDYLELRDPRARRMIAESNADIAAGRVKAAGSLLQPVPSRKKPRRAKS